MLCRYAALLFGGIVVVQAAPAWSQVNSAQQWNILKLSYMGCMLTQSSKHYSATGDLSKIASAVQKACDVESTSYFQFQKSHPDLVRGQQISLEDDRTAERQLTEILVLKIRSATAPKINTLPSPSSTTTPIPVSPLLVQGPNGGRFAHFSSSGEYNTEFKMAQAYCTKLGRHATITFSDQVEHSFAFHCFRNVTGQQLFAGDNRY